MNVTMLYPVELRVRERLSTSSLILANIFPLFTDLHWSRIGSSSLDNGMPLILGAVGQVLEQVFDAANGEGPVLVLYRLPSRE